MLEKLLEAIIGLTNALNANTAALGGEAGKAKGKAAAKGADTATGTAGSTANQTSAGASAGQQAAGPTVKDVVDIFGPFANTNRAAAVALLVKYGANEAQPKLDQVNPTTYAALIADIKAASAAANTSLF